MHFRNTPAGCRPPEWLFCRAIRRQQSGKESAMIDLPPPAVPAAFICEAPRAIDGDTIGCANSPVRIRLLGIDAPELPGHCRRGRTCTPGDGEASTRALADLLAGGPGGTVVWIRPEAFDHYGRILARAEAGKTDLSCAMIAAQAAVPRYSSISC
jgi:micrococcal nuclease